jgi:uncharacterized protein YndB with AHSA1/START domain
MSSRVLVALRIAAARERVFEAFTREIGLWWRPNPMFLFAGRTDGKLAIEPGLGGRFTETYPDGTAFEIGRVTLWEPDMRLGLSWRQASFADEQSTEVEVRFETVGPETRVTVEHRGWDAIPFPHAARHGMPNTLFLQRHGQYWQALVASLRDTVEAEALGRS